MRQKRYKAYRYVDRKKLRRRLSRKLGIGITNSVVHGIEDLICGLPVAAGPYVDSDYSGLVDRLRSDVAELHPQIRSAVSEVTGLPSSAVFPFLARKFLELSLTSLLARIDPLRVIAARKNQRDSSFEAGRQNASSISWSGDIIPKNPPPKGGAWQSLSLEKGVERSVLGWHFGEVAIAPGLQWLSDIDNTNSEWLRDICNQDSPFEWIKGRLTQLYSTLSKGVHAEYLLDDRTAFDQASVQQHMQDCYRLVLLLATATHISPLFVRSLSPENALAALRILEVQIATKDE